MFEEASWEISPNTGINYSCTQRDLDADRGIFKQTFWKRSPAELRAILFSQPNRVSLVGIKTASRDIFEHNDPDRNPSANEWKAIGRLLTMLDNACHGSWCPDLAIKTFFDLDSVFFRGKLKGHVCINWADPEAFSQFRESTVFAHAPYLDKGKALIQLNAQSIFFDWGCSGGKTFQSDARYGAA